MRFAALLNEFGNALSSIRVYAQKKEQDISCPALVILPLRQIKEASVWALAADSVIRCCRECGQLG